MHTLASASARAENMILAVSNSTAKTCIRENCFPNNHPTNNVVTLPPERRMICTGTEMLKTKT